MATNTTLNVTINEIWKEIPDVSTLAEKVSYDAKLSEIENNILIILII